MRLIRIKKVINVSSQDKEHPISDIVNSIDTVPTKKWLSSPLDKARKLEAEFELECPTVIRRIDIGNCGSTAVEIHAGNTNWPSHIPYKTILDNVTFRSFDETKNNANFNSVKIFTDENFSADVKNQLFNRIKVICCQPYMQPLQFGLSFLNFRTDDIPIKFSSENFYSHDSDENFPPLMDRVSHLTSIRKSYTSRGQQLVDAALSKNRKLDNITKQLDNKPHEPNPNDLELNITLFLTSKDTEYLHEYVSLQEAIEDYENNFNVVLNDTEKEEFCKIFKTIFSSSPRPEQFSNQNSRPSGYKRSYEESMDCLNIVDDKSKDNESHTPKEYKRRCKRLETSSSYTTSSTQSPQVITLSDPEEPSSSNNTYRPDDFVQQDGSIPSTSSVVSYVDCPICLKQFHVNEIEAHASVCENYCKPNLDSSDDEDDNSESVVHNFHRTKC